jgi:hypothetical protein
MQQETNVSFGIKWGVLIGVVYSVLLLLRYTTGATNPIMLGLWAFVGYLAVFFLIFI